MYHADLHTHTIHSDGEYTPAHLGLMALQSGIRYLAYTDHNYSYSARLRVQLLLSHRRPAPRGDPHRGPEL